MATLTGLDRRTADSMQAYAPLLTDRQVSIGVMPGSALPIARR